MSPSCSLLHLPNELQLAILEALPTHDILSLSRISKGANTVADVILYSQVTMEWKMDLPPPRLDLLLHALFQRPQRRAHVRKLLLHGARFRDHEYTMSSIPTLCVEGLQIEQASAYIQQFGLPTDIASKWLDNLQEGSIDAVLCLLISMLRNLTELNLDSTFTYSLEMTANLLRHILWHSDKHSDLPFHQLRYIRLHSPHDIGARMTRQNNSLDSLPLFYLPHLQHLATLVDNPINFTWPGGIPDSCQISSLEIDRIREQRLSPILSILPNLDNLRWGWFFRNDRDVQVSHSVIDLDVMTSALRYVENTVTNLEVEATIKVSANDIEFPVLSISGSLSLIGFSKLKQLSIPWTFLMGLSPSEGKALIDVLPQSLESLCITEGLLRSDSWDWWADGRYGDYENEDNEDPTAIMAAMITFLGDNRRPPLLHIISFRFKRGHAEEMTPEQQIWLEEFCERSSIKVGWYIGV